MQKLICAGWDKVFLGEELDRVGYQSINDAQVERQLTEDCCPVGADAVLHGSTALALNPQEQPSQVEHHQEDHEGQEKGDTEVNHGFVTSASTSSARTVTESGHPEPVEG